MGYIAVLGIRYAEGVIERFDYIIQTSTIYYFIQVT
jgi:hypothetical protein